MDYSKQGGQRPGRNAPRHAEHNAPGSDRNPFGQRPTKAQLVERMKAAAARKADASDGEEPTSKG